MAFTLFIWWFREGDSISHIESVEIAGLNFRLSSQQRTAAWFIFVEVISRIATQPLTLSSGDNREALNSLHSLFESTRKTLRDMPPSPIAEGTTIEIYATMMLNRHLRPFLSKWHPLLKQWEAKNAENMEKTEWPSHSDFRTELEKVRGEIVECAKTFGTLARVAHLEKFF